MGPGREQDDEREPRVRRRVVVGEPGRVGVAFEMVHPNQRQALPVRERLGRVHSHHERAHEPRTAGDGDRVDLVERDLRLAERRFEHRDHLEQVLARGHLRYDAAVARVYRHLRSNDVRNNAPPILHDGGGGFVA